MNGDVPCILSHGIAKLVDKLVDESSFFEANCYLQIICVDFGRRYDCEMMNVEFNMSLHETELHFYCPTRVQKMEAAFSALFCKNYLSEFGFPLMSVDQLRTLVDRAAVMVLLRVVMMGMASLEMYGLWYEAGGIVVVVF